MKQTEAIRQALRELGVDAAHADVEQWVKGKGVKPTATFASLVSQWRKKLRAELPPPAAESSARTGTIDVAALAEFRKLIGDDVKLFRLWVERIDKAAGLCGGMGQLRAFLDIWQG